MANGNGPALRLTACSKNKDGRVYYDIAAFWPGKRDGRPTTEFYGGMLAGAYKDMAAVRITVVLNDGTEVEIDTESEDGFFLNLTDVAADERRRAERENGGTKKGGRGPAARRGKGRRQQEDDTASDFA